jgi:hypothetical protein
LVLFTKIETINPDQPPFDFEHLVLRILLITIQGRITLCMCPAALGKYPQHYTLPLK